jgi:hypothetical protein
LKRPDRDTGLFFFILSSRENLGRSVSNVTRETGLKEGIKVVGDSVTKRAELGHLDGANRCTERI